MTNLATWQERKKVWRAIRLVAEFFQAILFNIFLFYFWALVLDFSFYEAKLFTLRWICSLIGFKYSKPANRIGWAIAQGFLNFTFFAGHKQYTSWSVWFCLLFLTCQLFRLAAYSKSILLQEQWICLWHLIYSRIRNKIISYLCRWLELKIFVFIDCRVTNVTLCRLLYQKHICGFPWKQFFPHIW